MLQLLRWAPAFSTFSSPGCVWLDGFLVRNTVPARIVFFRDAAAWQPGDSMGIGRVGVLILGALSLPAAHALSARTVPARLRHGSSVAPASHIVAPHHRSVCACVYHVGRLRRPPVHRHAHCHHTLQVGQLYWVRERCAACRRSVWRRSAATRRQGHSHRHANLLLAGRPSR